MKKRLENLRRLVALKERQRQATEGKLARLDAEERAAAAEEAEIIAALNDTQPLHGLFVDVMARHLRVVAERRIAIRQAKAEETARLQNETRQLRHSEKVHDELARRHDRMMEEKALAELIDAAASRDAASLPKASKGIF
jgi:hypothetical protein